jgi:hypothetical protein
VDAGASELKLISGEIKHAVEIKFTLRIESIRESAGYQAVGTYNPAGFAINNNEVIADRIVVVEIKVRLVLAALQLFVKNVVTKLQHLAKLEGRFRGFENELARALVNLMLRFEILEGKLAALERSHCVEMPKSSKRASSLDPSHLAQFPNAESRDHVLISFLTQSRMK